MKRWQAREWLSCPDCGDVAEVYTDAEGEMVSDSEDARCSAACGWGGGTNVYEDGSASVQDGLNVLSKEHGDYEAQMLREWFGQEGR